MNRTVVRNGMAFVLSVALLIGVYASHLTLVNRRAPTIDAVLQTSIALVGSLVAFLAFGRYRRFGNVSDLLIFIAVLLLAWVHTLFMVLPNLISPNRPVTG